MNIQNSGNNVRLESERNLLAKKAKLKQPLKPVDMCDEVQSRLHLTSPRIPLSDNARTVCLQVSPDLRSSHSFDFRFVANNNQVRHLLSAQTHEQDVVILSHPDDLSQGNLLSRLSIAGTGHHSLKPGKLFENNEPLTLVIDIRTLTSEELPKLNDLLDPDNPCLFDKVTQKKRALGKHVSLLVLASHGQLAMAGKSDEAPGADFWRRINRPGNTWQFDADNGNDQTMDIGDVPPVLAELPPDSAMDDGNTVIIHCHLHSNWRQLFFGGPAVDKQGRIRHLSGKFEQLQVGQRVILKGADWNNLAFEQTIRQLLAQKRYESNGAVCTLPEDIQFYRMPVGDDELLSLFQTMANWGDARLACNEPQNLLIINHSNITEWLGPISIGQEGFAFPNTSLLDQVKAGDVVTVTSPLSEALWFLLLGALQNIHQTTGVKPKLQVDHSQRQPQSLGLTEKAGQPELASYIGCKDNTGGHAPVNTVTYQHSAQANHWINGHQGTPLVIQINNQTGFSQLFDNIFITSEQKAHFGRCQSGLQAALSTGKPVVFRGLESNPKLQQLLEPLVYGQPLLVNGTLQAYPKACITVLWPGLAQSPSPVWSAMIAAAESCPPVDIWNITAEHHGMSRSELPEQVLRQLCEAFKTVPATLCHPLPEITEGMLNNLILAARRAQQVDHAPQLQPCHWRKAINSVFSHGTRQNPSVRDFMKVACRQLLPDAAQTAWVDPERLNAVISSAQPLDRSFVRLNVWQLARAFGPTVFANTVFEQPQLFYESPFRAYMSDECMDCLCALIVAQTPRMLRSSVAFQLQVDPLLAEQYQQLTIRPQNQIRRLEDALASGWQLRPYSVQTRSDAIHTLATDCYRISQERVARKNEPERIARLEHLLAQSLEWQGCAQAPLQALAHDLYYGSVNQKDRELRRLSRLYDRLEDSPVIFLQGETGTGKSYFAAKTAEASGLASLISLGPCDSEQTLMKRWQWRENTGTGGDRYMALQERALLEWANTQPAADGHYVTVVLDEANLANTGLQASLNGLWEPTPCIYVNGHPVKVTAQHRVILTGNPVHYAGRQLDPVLKEKLPGAYYLPLNRAYLRDRVVEPALLRQLQRYLPEPQTDDIVRSASDRMMVLWQYYPELLPEHEFTPRDLTDICSWVGWYLDRALSNGHRQGSVTRERVDGLILQSFQDVLGSEIPGVSQDARTALELWFSAHDRVDNTLRDLVHTQVLEGIRNTFIRATLQTRPEFDTSGSAVSELVQRLGQDLSRCQQAHHHVSKHHGRQATLIEGPAGRGKDVTLNLLIESFKQQVAQRGESMPEVFYCNAGDCPWDRVCEAIQRAKVNGGIVVISELNLIDSQHLEGELNDILAGDAHPGFHLFATTNPPRYSGRKPLSPALKGRFRHLPIRQYNPAELQAIVEKVLPQTPKGKSAAELLTQWHCQLRACLQQQGLPLQPTGLDLQNLARAVIKEGDFTENTLRQHINHHYHLYFIAVRATLEKLPELSAVPIGQWGIDPILCNWFHHTKLGSDRPWLIRRSNLNHIDEQHHEIQIKADLGDAEARTEIIKRVAQAQWLASDLSPKPKDADDTLTQTLYRYWQHCWFDHRFNHTGVEANTVFTLTDAQKQTLKISTNQPYFREADKQISAWDANKVFLWPAFWQKISRIVSNPVRHYSCSGNRQGTRKRSDFHSSGAEAIDQKRAKKEEVIDGQYPGAVSVKSGDTYNSPGKPLSDHSAAQSAPRENGETEASTISANYTLPLDKQAELPAKTILHLDVDTAYEHRELPQLVERKIFSSRESPRMYRLEVFDVALNNKGNVELRSFSPGALGFEVVLPSALPDGEVTLGSGQSLGVHCLWVDKDKYFYLPGLNPDETIQAWRIKPSLDYRLIKDRYTGLHMVRFPNVGDDQEITVNYVVEKRVTKSSCKKLSVETLDLLQQSGDARLDCTVSDPMKLQLTEFFNGFAAADMPENQKKQIHCIQSAKTLKDRIAAIAEYCENFKGSEKYEGGEGFFRFLLWRQQGSCQHRTPIFVALCRYFGIPARAVRAKYHLYPEYSLDGGMSWKPEDLGGAPVKHVKRIEPDFQPFRQGGGSSTESKKIKAFLESTDPEQQQRLAKAYNWSIKDLHKALEAGCALPSKVPSTSEVVRRLWEKKDLTGFSLGVSILEKKETLNVDESGLIGRVFCRNSCTYYKPMSEAVSQILSSSSEDQVSGLLKALYSKAIVHNRYNDHDHWLGSIVDILTESNSAHPPVIQFAVEAFKAGWLRPPQRCYTDIIPARKYHDLMVRLETVKELKAQAVNYLGQWYKALLTPGMNSQKWLSYYDWELKGDNHFFVTQSFNGVSPFLVEKIDCSSLQLSWTDNPEGIPDIERMLVRKPAFPQFNASKTGIRPVIILGKPDWAYTVIADEVEAHYPSEPWQVMETNFRHSLTYTQYFAEVRKVPRRDTNKTHRSARLPAKREGSRNQKESEEYNKKTKEIWTRYKPIINSLHVPGNGNSSVPNAMVKQAIYQAFTYYLYHMTKTRGGRLTYCFLEASVGRRYSNRYGAHEVSSPEELYAMMTKTQNNSALEKSVKARYLSQAHNTDNALVLKSEELTTIAREFLNTVNFKSIYELLLNRDCRT
ncbi:AAA family ATPase [Salinisphaera sp. G21_0]|uniref:AAA family ATPase n=1 Tax=Salinisphaera sp. G21_0 TaxID=2821094 RepID=UPI001ADA6A8B|nr:AAA family ATPase [Salinisphaera sp. G21_0]MBO9480227.1 AAA family ATPase [Salinisphaera sp. G21_0]